MFLATAVPEIVDDGARRSDVHLLVLGRPVTAWNGANPFEALHGQHYVPSWFVAIFLIFAIVQLFGINSLDLYSSGVSLQAMGFSLRRYQAVMLDSFSLVDSRSGPSSSRRSRST